MAGSGKVEWYDPGFALGIPDGTSAADKGVVGESSVTSVRMAKRANMSVVNPCDEGCMPCTFSFAKALASLRASALACAVAAATGMFAN